MSAEMKKMKKFAKELGIDTTDLKQSELKEALLYEINDRDDIKNDAIVKWFNDNIDEEETEAAPPPKAKAKAKASAKGNGKGKKAPAKAKAKPSKEAVAKSRFNHRLSKMAGMIDKVGLKGGTYEEIMKEAGCDRARIRDHFKHLQEVHGCTIQEPSKEGGKVKIVAPK
jgi:hypothetical protein